MTQFDTSLILNQTVSQMVGTYDIERERIRRAYADLDTAQANLEASFGESYFSTLPNHTYSNPSDGILDRLKCSAWRAIVNKLDIRKIMSVKRWNELNERLEDPGKLPELTLPAIADILNSFVQNANDFFHEAVIEAFDYLRPHENYSGARYKTNQKNAKFEIGKKIIITGMVSVKYGGGFSVSYYQDQKLIALDKVFSQLDGRTINDSYKSPLVDAINISVNGFAETEYFRAWCYRNGNVHLEFKRMDLLKTFNAIAGGANLKG